MLKIVLTNRLINAIAKRIFMQYLCTKIGPDGKVTVNEFYAVENEGKVTIKINAEVEMRSEEAEKLIGRL